jgi:hypothetical protein
MSRTRKPTYTKSRRFDSSCRNAGSCPYCRRNRLVRDQRLGLRTGRGIRVRERDEQGEVTGS